MKFDNKQMAITVEFLAKSWTEAPYSVASGAGKLARATIINEIRGGGKATGTLEYLLAYPSSVGGDVLFTGMERIVGSIGSRQGSFVLRHDGIFSQQHGVSGTLTIIPASGAGDFANILGHGTIKAKPGEHGGQYSLIIEN